MPDDSSKPETDAGRPEGLAPEVHNSEQDDELEQAQTLADEALRRQSVDYGAPTESVKVNGYNLEEDSTQDLVDHMRDMEASGRIDMGAYAGEDNMDDNEDKYGEENRLDDLPSEGS
jgi:hypothetical protein